MKQKTRTLCLLAGLLGVVGAQVAAAQESRRILVVPFNPINVTRQEAELVYGAFESSLGRTGAYSLAGREEISAALEDRGLDLFGCTSDRFALELGSALSAGQVVRGDLSAREGGYALKIRLLEVASGQVVYLDALWTRSVEEMRQSMELFAFKLAGLVVIEGKATRVAREFGEVFVETSPSRAHVYINGIRKGVSPDLLARVPLGRVQISARLGALYGEKTVEVTRSMDPVRIELAEASGTVLVASRENLDVYLDGGLLEPLGTGTFAGIPVGIHALELKGRGLYWRDDVVVRAGEQTTVVALSVPYGTIEHGIPAGAAAEIRGGMIREVVTGYGSLDLPAGDYSVNVSGKDFETQEGMAVTVARESTTPLRPQLRLARDAAYEQFTRRIEEAARTVGYGLRLTSGGITRLKALREEIAGSPHAFPDLLARAEALVAQAEAIVAAEAAPLPVEDTGKAEINQELGELMLRRQELEVQIETKRLERSRKNARGWVSFGVGLASGGLVGLFRYLSNEAYLDYQTAGSLQEARSKEAQVRLWDISTIAALGTSGVCLVVSSALWASSPSIRQLRQELQAIDREIKLERSETP